MLFCHAAGRLEGGECAGAVTEQANGTGQGHPGENIANGSAGKNHVTDRSLSKEPFPARQPYGDELDVIANVVHPRVERRRTGAGVGETDKSGCGRLRLRQAHQILSREHIFLAVVVPAILVAIADRQFVHFL